MFYYYLQLGLHSLKRNPLLTALMVISGETLGPWAQGQADVLKSSARYESNMSMARYAGLWAREGNTFLNAQSGEEQHHRQDEPGCLRPGRRQADHDGEDDRHPPAARNRDDVVGAVVGHVPELDGSEHRDQRTGHHQGEQPRDHGDQRH